jgi:hypothetical protein
MNSVQAVESSSEPRDAAHPIAKVVFDSPGPAPCRCGRYFSEDFEGRLFCRGCEGTDAADITPRLPLCQRP